MTVELFSVAGRERIALAAELPTPLGTIALSFRSGDAFVGSPPDEAWSVGPDAGVLAWNRAEFRAELLLGPATARLPAGMTVSGCRVGVWRVRAKTNLPDCEFPALWTPGRSPASGGPESGQGLVAQTWSDGALNVSLGTSDAEWLARCEPGWEMPESWAELVGAGDPTDVVIEDYRDNGLSIRLPGLAAGEGGQVHFVTAWAPTEPDDHSTWFAVDLTPRQAVEALGVP